MTRITSLDVWECRVPLPRQLDMGNLTIPHRDYTIVRLRDSDGCEGIAWTYSRGADIASAIRRSFSPLVIGCTIDNQKHPTGLWHRLYESNPYVNQAGIFLRALSLVDIALWELFAGKRGGKLGDLMDSKPLTGPPTAAACYPISSKLPHDDASEALELVKRGYRSIKVCAADGASRDTERLIAIREAVGHQIELKLDLHWLWQRAEQINNVRHQWERLDLAWIEDAIPIDSLSEFRKLKDLTKIPIAYGDEQNGRAICHQLITSGAIDVLRLDATVVGGLTEFIRLGRLANASGLRVSGHLFEEYHTAALGTLDDATNIERFEADSGLDAIDRLRKLAPQGIRWNWEAIEEFKLI
jgi:D-arabinonate dehydratase